MKRLLFKSPKFIKTALLAKDYPLIKNNHGEPLPEVAVAGRSNVGKSSLLNDLFLVRGLVRVSATPGKTQCLNFFTLNDELTFVDLPGYGFAEVPLKVRAKWGPMVQTYLETREELKLILFLFDIRRLPNDEDRLLLDWIERSQKEAILVITKADKVTRNELAANTAKILDAFGVEDLPYVHYSVKKNLGGREGLIRMIRNLIQPEVDTI